jgi:hypothetical protein
MAYTPSVGRLDKTMSSRVFLIAVSAALIVAGTPAGAAERSPEEVCAMFPHAQTYRATTGFYRAPAWHYGRTVTVRYIAASCTATSSSIDVSGTALVYKGASFTSSPVARGFSFTLDWRTPQGTRNWPIAWWICSKTTVDYHWSIAGVYDYSVTNRGGLWRATQRSLVRHPRTSSLSIPACG